MVNLCTYFGTVTEKRSIDMIQQNTIFIKEKPILKILLNTEDIVSGEII